MRPPHGDSTSSTLPLQRMGPDHVNAAIAMAASQAIAATQQLSGRRTSSLKASLEAITEGVHAHEFSIGRELAGAAQAAIASTSFASPVSLPMLDEDAPVAKKRKKGNRSTDTDLDAFGGAGSSRSLLDEVAPPTDDLIIEGIEPEWTYDPNEPRYCTCNQVSYGEMVACDNEDVSLIIDLENQISP